jgi:hypothetical protein
MPSQYSFVKRLGKGTQGDVWLAVDGTTNGLVAVKVGRFGGGGELVCLDHDDYGRKT